MATRTRTKSAESETVAPATDSDSAPETVQSETVEAPKRKKAPAVKLEDIKFDVAGITPAPEENPFARGSKNIPEGHPILEAFRQSYAAKRAIRVPTETPEEFAKLVRRIAAQEHKGSRIVPIQPGDQHVTFMGTDRKKMAPRKKAVENAEPTA